MFSLEKRKQKTESAPAKQRRAKQAVLTIKEDEKQSPFLLFPKKGLVLKEGKTADEHKRGPKGWSPDTI